MDPYNYYEDEDLDIDTQLIEDYNMFFGNIETNHKSPRHKPSKHKPSKHEHPKHEPPRHEHPKHEPPRHEPPKHEPPRHEPPKFVPKHKHTVRAVDPSAIRDCLYNYVYIWLENGSSFWMYPTHVGRKSIAGYRWMYYGWSYIGFDLDMISSFHCSSY